MKVNSVILLELNKEQSELLNEQYTRTVVKMITSELSLQEINELIKNLVITSIP